MLRRVHETHSRLTAVVVFSVLPLLHLYSAVVLVYNELHELVLEIACEIQDAAYLVRYDVRDGIHADVVGGGAQAVVLAVVVAGKVVVLGFVGGTLVVQRRAAVGDYYFRC